MLQAVFEAAAALARYHVQEVAAGRAGLGPNNAAGKPRRAAAPPSPLAPLLRAPTRGAGRGPRRGALGPSLTAGIAVPEHPTLAHPAASARRHRFLAPLPLPCPVPAGPDGATPLGSLLLASLQRLVHGDAGLEAVDHAAEAVLPLALADPPALQRAGEALLAACADGAAKVRGPRRFACYLWCAWGRWRLVRG